MIEKQIENGFALLKPFIALMTSFNIDLEKNNMILFLIFNFSKLPWNFKKIYIFFGIQIKIFDL